MKAMNDEVKFNSQICTSVEQSKRLLELGLKPETADMKHFFDNRNDYSFFHHWECIPYEWDKEFLVDSENIPAWSLHRLIEICNKTQFGMTISIYNNEVTIDGDLFEVFDNTYDNLISIIEWLIKRGHFNKEYLKQ